MRDIQPFKYKDCAENQTEKFKEAPLWKEIEKKSEYKPLYNNYDASIVKKWDEFPKKLLTEKNLNLSSDEIVEEPLNVYNNLETMKKELGKSYKEIKEIKPPNSPNISKWFENGGTIKIEVVDGKYIWTYTDAEGRSVQYIDGKIKFPEEAKHPVIKDIDIGEFTGDRAKDKELYLQKLEEEYGLTEIPEGYVLHHDTENGTMQLIREDYHKEFTHMGGHSMYKEAE